MTSEHKQQCSHKDTFVKIDPTYKYTISDLYDLTKNSKSARHFYLTNTQHYHTVLVTNIEPSLLSNQSHIEQYFRQLCPTFANSLFRVKNFATFTFNSSHLQLFLHFKHSFKSKISQFINLCNTNATNPSHNKHHSQFIPTLKRFIFRKRTEVKYGVLLLGVHDMEDGEVFLCSKLNECLNTNIKPSSCTRFPSKLDKSQPGSTILVKFTNDKSKQFFMNRFDDLCKNHGFIFNDNKVLQRNYIQQQRTKEVFLCGKCSTAPFHIGKNCFKKTFSCGICPGSHPTNECTEPYNVWCRRCKCTDHATISIKCPTIQRYLFKGYKYVVKDPILIGSAKIANNTKTFLKPTNPNIPIQSTTNNVSIQHNKSKPSPSPVSFSRKLSHNQRKKQIPHRQRKVPQHTHQRRQLKLKVKSHRHTRPQTPTSKSTTSQNHLISDDRSTPPLPQNITLPSRSPTFSIPQASPPPPHHLYKSIAFGDQPINTHQPDRSSRSIMSSIINRSDSLNFHNLHFLPKHFRKLYSNYDG